MTSHQGPVRLSYTVESCAPPKGSPADHHFRVKVVYESGKTFFLRANFRTRKEANSYIERFYPDLVGKCRS